MDNPNYYPPDFKRLCELNREKDLSCFFKKELPLVSRNNLEFPSKVYVLNLDDRSDRWERFNHNNTELFANFEVVRFPAIKKDPVVDAIFDSFTKCIGEAKEESFLILEDDCYLVSGGLEKLKLAWSDLPSDWDALIGNHYFFTDMELIGENLAKPIGRASTANFGVYRKTLVEKIEANKEFREVTDSKDWDHFLCLVPEINNYTVWPMISREMAGFSDHKNRILDMNMRLREHSYKYQFVDQINFYENIWRK